MRTLAIGDVHGASSALDALMNFVKPTADDVLVFLGDYVDRGPDSKGVLDRLMAWSESLQMVCLRGNHEQMMLDSRTDRMSNTGRCSVCVWNEKEARLTERANAKSKANTVLAWLFGIVLVVFVHYLIVPSS